MHTFAPIAALGLAASASAYTYQPGFESSLEAREFNIDNYLIARDLVEREARGGGGRSSGGRSSSGGSRLSKGLKIASTGADVVNAASNAYQTFSQRDLEEIGAELIARDAEAGRVSTGIKIAGAGADVVNAAANAWNAFKGPRDLEAQEEFMALVTRDAKGGGGRINQGIKIAGAGADVVNAAANAWNAFRQRDLEEQEEMMAIIARDAEAGRVSTGIKIAGAGADVVNAAANAWNAFKGPRDLEAQEEVMALVTRDAKGGGGRINQGIKIAGAGADVVNAAANAWNAFKGPRDLEAQEELMAIIARDAEAGRVSTGIKIAGAGADVVNAAANAWNAFKGPRDLEGMEDPELFARSEFDFDFEDWEF